MTMRVLSLCSLLSALPLAAGAHPHVFIDAQLTLDYQADGLVQVAVEWTYDDFYSLLIVEDLGLDPDGDGILTPDEQSALQGFDAEWEPGFDGRLYLGVEGRRIPLADARDFTAQYRNGRLTSRHVRPLRAPLDAALPLLIQVYDPEYYVQFSIPELPVIAGQDCRADLRMGDPYAAADAYARAVAEALAESPDADPDQEMLVVDIGAVGADSVTIRCELGS